MILISFWLDFFAAQRKAYYAAATDETSFLQWRPWTIEGVANICGV